MKKNSPEANSCKTKVVTLPADTVAAIRIALKENQEVVNAQSGRIDQIKQALDGVVASEPKVFDDLLASPDHLQRLLAKLKENGLDSSIQVVVTAASQRQQAVIAAAIAELADVRRTQESLVERIKSLETWKAEFVGYVDEKDGWLQKQLEVLDDQSSLQGALLVKLAEHANPRRPAPPTPARSPVVSAAAMSQQPQQPQQPQHRPHQTQHAQQIVQPPPGVNGLVRSHQGIDVNNMSPRLVQVPNHQQPLAHLQMHPQQAPQYQQQQQPQQQHSPYNMPSAQYPYQDPNQRRSYH